MSMSVAPTIYAVGRLRNIRPKQAAELLGRVKSGFDYGVSDLNPPPEMKIEIAFTTDDFPGVVKEAQKLGLEIVAGTVTTPERAETAKQLSIKTIVAPDLNEEVGAKALELGLNYVPGIAWEQELKKLEDLVKQGKIQKPHLVKVFPFQGVRNAADLKKALSGPFGEEIDNPPKGKHVVFCDTEEYHALMRELGEDTMMFVHSPSDFSAALRSSKIKLIVFGTPFGGHGISSFNQLRGLVNEASPLKGIPFCAFGGVKLDDVAYLIQHGVSVIGTGSDLLGEKIVDAAAGGNFKPVDEKVDLLVKQVKLGREVPETA